MPGTRCNIAKYKVDDILRIHGKEANDPNVLEVRVKEVMYFSPRILYKLVVTRAEPAFPFPKVAYFESELDRFGAIKIEEAKAEEETNDKSPQEPKEPNS